MRALIYAAVSSARQADDDRESIPDQLRRAREVCEARNWPVVREITVPGHSRNYDWLHELVRDSPEYASLIDAIEQQIADVIVCKDHDRLWRTDALRAQVTALCRQYRCQIYAYDMPVEPVRPELLAQGADSRMIIEAMSGIVSQWENETRHRRQMMGMRGRVKRGLPASGIPWGYRKVPGTDVPEIDPEPARWVRHIFQRRSENWGTKRIADELNAYGVLTPRGKSTWTYSIVRHRLLNSFYWGVCHFGDTTARGLHEPIVDADLYAAVEAVNKRRHQHRSTVVYPLSGLCTCGYCDWGMSYRRMEPRAGHIYNYVQCNRYSHHGGKACQSNMHRVEPLEAYVMGRVREALVNPEQYLAWRAEQRNNGYVADELAALDAQISEIGERWERWNHLFEAGGITADEMLMHRERLYGQRDALNTRRAELADAAQSEQRIRAQIEELAGMADKLQDMTAEELNAAYTMLIESVVLRKDTDPRILWV